MEYASAGIGYGPALGRLLRTARRHTSAAAAATSAQAMPASGSIRSAAVTARARGTRQQDEYERGRPGAYHGDQYSSSGRHSVDYIYGGDNDYLFGKQEPNGIDLGMNYRDPGGIGRSFGTGVECDIDRCILQRG